MSTPSAYDLARIAGVSQALKALLKQLASHGYRTLVFTIKPNAEANSQIDDMLRYRVNAVILLSTNLSASVASACEAAAIPLIFFNRVDKTSASLCSVTGDNANGGREIAKLLVDVGYQRLAFMAGLPNSSTSNERSQAFSQELKLRGYPERR